MRDSDYVPLCDSPLPRKIRASPPGRMGETPIAQACPRVRVIIGSERRTERGAREPCRQTAFRINTRLLNRVLPKGATLVNPARWNMDTVPCVDSFPKARGSQRVMG